MHRLLFSTGVSFFSSENVDSREAIWVKLPWGLSALPTLSFTVLCPCLIWCQFSKQFAFIESLQRDLSFHNNKCSFYTHSIGLCNIYFNHRIRKTSKNDINKFGSQCKWFLEAIHARWCMQKRSLFPNFSPSLDPLRVILTGAGQRVFIASRLFMHILKLWEKTFWIPLRLPRINVNYFFQFKYFHYSCLKRILILYKIAHFWCLPK